MGNHGTDRFDAGARGVGAVVAALALLIVVPACGGSAASATSSTSTMVTSTTAPADPSTSAPLSTTAPATTSSTSAAATTATTAASVQVHSASWGAATVPGSVCRASQPIHLSGGKATITAPPALNAGTPQVTISEGSVAYGPLIHAGQDVATVNIWCANTSGTADGQLLNSWVVYSGDTGSLQVIGVLLPQQPATPAPPHVAFFDTAATAIVIQLGRITAHELWYAPADATCCPSVKATTVWTYASSTFHPTTTA